MSRAHRSDIASEIVSVREFTSEVRACVRVRACVCASVCLRAFCVRVLCARVCVHV
jgi:hypothetical protein